MYSNVKLHYLYFYVLILISLHSFFSFFLFFNPRYHDCYINGAKVSDMMLGRYTTFEIRVNYDTLDVSSLLHPGQANTIACGVGNGW